MTPTAISNIDAKLEYIVEIMVRIAEYEEKSIKEFRSDSNEIKESTRLFNEKLDRYAIEKEEADKKFHAKLDLYAAERQESARLFNEKLDRYAIEKEEADKKFHAKLDRISEQILIVNETSKRQEHNIDRLVGIVETLVKNVG